MRADYPYCYITGGRAWLAAFGAIKSTMRPANTIATFGAIQKHNAAHAQDSRLTQGSSGAPSAFSRS